MSQSGQIPANHKSDGMYKSQLQEFCQRRSWPLPEYETIKEGPLHCPYFKATVIVNGLAFHTSNFFNRAKDAQIEAAKLALAHLTSEPPPPAGGTIDGNSPAAGIEGASAMNINANKRRMTNEIRAQTVEGVQTVEKNSETKRIKHSGELHMYKNQLQSVVLKKGYDLPVYTFEHVGPPHNSRFKSKVTVNGQAYESPDFFGTLKESEHAAAKVALSSLLPPESQDVILDKSVFKNLLQELAQKSGLKVPIYNTTGSGAGHMPTFVSTVVVGGETFSGEEAKTKKHAEMNAAEVAYTCLSQREILGPSGSAPVCVPIGVSASNLQSLDTYDSVAANQLGAPSMFISSQCNSGLPKSGDQEAPKQVPSYAGIGSKDSMSSPSVGITTPLSPLTHANPSDSSDYIPLSRDECSSPQTSPEVLHGSVPVSTPDIFGGSNSSLRDTVRVYPRILNMDIPACAVVQHADDKWIAVKFPANQTGH